MAALRSGRILIIAALVALVGTSAGSLASAPQPHMGIWRWTEPESPSVAASVPPRLGPSVAATLVIEGAYGPSADWEATMSDATVTCRSGTPHYSPTVRGGSFFDTFVPGECHLGVDPDGHLHAYWFMGVENGDTRVGPMRGDGYFT